MTFAFGVFLLRQFFLTVPGELEDAARIDGADHWHIFTRIVLPLSQPVLGIFAFRSAWNDFLWPLIAVNKSEMFPLPLGPRAPSRRLWLGVVRTHHGGRDAERPAAADRVPRGESPDRGGREGERAQGVGDVV
jgi:hypothetical protein